MSLDIASTLLMQPPSSSIDVSWDLLSPSYKPPTLYAIFDKYLYLNLTLQMLQLKTAEILVSMSEGLAFGLTPENNYPQPLNLSSDTTSRQVPNNDIWSLDTEGELHRRLKFKLHRTKPHETAASNLKHKAAGAEPASRLTEVCSFPNHF